jgi:hypothetical protein
MPENGSTSALLQCACGCEQPVKPGQRWHEPACKARAYRAQQRASHDSYLDELQAEEHWNVDRIMELSRKLTSLEQAHSQLIDEHRQCPRDPAPSPEQAWAWRYFMDALGTAYRDAAKSMHPDHHGDNRQLTDKFRDLSAVYAEMRGFIHRHAPRA